MIYYDIFFIILSSAERRYRINVAKVSTFYAVILKELRSQEKERVRGKTNYIGLG